MIIKYYHLGLRQVVMALMIWAIDVPQLFLQNDAKLLLVRVRLALFFFTAALFTELFYKGKSKGRGRDNKINLIFLRFS